MTIRSSRLIGFYDGCENKTPARMLRRHVCISHCHFSSYYALMCIILSRLPPQISFLGGKYLYEKRENLAVNNLIKLILNHLYRQFCHCYCQKNT